MLAGDGRPSYEELAALVAQQARVIEELRAEVARLSAENAEFAAPSGDELDEFVEAAVVGFAVYQARAEVVAR